MIVTSSVAILRVMVKSTPENEVKSGFDIQSIPTRPCEVKTALSQAVPWVSFDSTAPGTPAEAHVIISDTTGITIVADFYGFWRGSYSINGTPYDDLGMPGASLIREPGVPMLPVLTELVEIPHDIDVSLEILASSNDTDSLYNIRPAPPLHFPVGIGEYLANATPQTTVPPSFLGHAYFENAVFPRVRANISGSTGAAPLIIRDHRILELSFYPVQYNPASGFIMVFSQIVVKIKYSSPAQIQPVRESLRSNVFERILERSLIHYDSIHIRNPPQPGHPTSYIRTELPPSMPNATVPRFRQSSISSDYESGAEYLIITTDVFKNQAQRLAEWKERKGTPSRVEIIRGDLPRDDKIMNVKGIIEYAYNHWDPGPTYVLLFGDVEAIPTNYDMKHEGSGHKGKYFKEGYFASDLGYFTVQGNSFFPDIIYGRISVDTEEQAEIVVNKTLLYEQSPPDEDLFYNSILTAGYFQDIAPRNGYEDEQAPFIYRLENIRHYLKSQYLVHYNYSSAFTKQEPRYFHAPLKTGPKTNVVSLSMPEYDWLYSYDEEQYRSEANANITSNINDGRFLVMYYGHGGSKNMIYPYDMELTTNNRDLTEGWHTPCFTTPYFSLLQNEYKTPLILSIACSTGWFDGETDQLSCELWQSGDQYFEENAFTQYDLECFAEEITRLEGGGAIAAIAASRQVPALMEGSLLDGIIQSFWPGFLGSENQPIYQMGGALFNGKMYAGTRWLNTESYRDEIRMIYEGYHLFGDPETKLWTDAPSEFNVTYPDFIGTKGEQKFVVTVRDNKSGQPVINAKVCVQQVPRIYEVGYSDSNGQVIFDVEPLDISWSLNLTVTKHNYIPHIGEIDVLKSFDAVVTITPEVGLGGEIQITVEEFDTKREVDLYFDNAQQQSFVPSSQPILREISRGDAGYITVRAVQGNTIATNRFYRLSTLQNPDPYIYSQKDSSTWDLADDELVWDNPCITIYDGKTPVDHLDQERGYTINVTVYNRGNGDAENTNVTLWDAQFGGGLSWDEVDTKKVTIPVSGYKEVSFTWLPRFTDTVSLKVTISQANERPEDRINNMGTECWNIFPLCSVGESIFEVGNPSDETEYVSINVKQEGDHEDVWSASVQDYPPQALDPDDIEDATLFVDPGYDLGPEDGRTFTAEIYVNGERVLGLEFNGICETIWKCIGIAAVFLILLFVLAIICWWVRRPN
jgi:hypothetical protein